MRPPSPTFVTTMINLREDQAMASILSELPKKPSLLDSVTHIVCSPWVCGIKGDDDSSVRIMRVKDSTTNSNLIDGGSNVCITGDLNFLLNVVDIAPIDILVALSSSSSSLNNKISKRGLLPLTLLDGTIYYQTCFYCAHMAETIISPAAVLASSDVFYFWSQEGCKDPQVPGRVKFTSRDGLLSMQFDLVQRDGLYYCDTNAFTVDRDPVRPHCQRSVTHVRDKPPKFVPTSKARQVESKMWLLQFGSPGEHQLDVLPLNVIGMPKSFEYHPFCLINFKEQAYIRKQAAGRTAERIPTCGAEFFMDFAFMRASTEDYKRPNKATDWVVMSYDGYSSHLVIVDSVSCRVWALLTKSKDPPINILRAFLKKFGVGSGVIRTDQGGELARSDTFCDMVLVEFGYVVKPTGADSPSQNGGTESYNHTLAVKIRTLLYGPSLPARFWSAALLHAVYLHNCLVHSATERIPYEGWYGRKPDVTHLKMFGSRVCVKRTGSRRCMLDRHDFTGIFLGYTATNQNIIYLNLDSGIVKSCHHAVFNEAWYLQQTCPPAAQLLYDLGLEANSECTSHDGPLPPTPAGSITPVTVPWPPLVPKCTGNAQSWVAPLTSLFAPLPLRITDAPNMIAARAARLSHTDGPRSKKHIVADIVAEYLIGASDMAMIYVSLDPYGSVFEEELDLRKFDITTHRSAGLCFFEKNGRLLLASMAPSTPGARVPR
jgi:hypothetical protein